MTETSSPEALELRRVFGAYPTGVAVIAGVVDGEPIGLAVNSFTSVSLNPPLASFCIANSSNAWPILRRARRVGVNILAMGQEGSCRQLAGPPAHRFDGVSWASVGDGAIRLKGVSAWLECEIDQEVTAGDHRIVLLRVRAVDADHSLPPLVFHASRYTGLMADWWASVDLDI